MLCHATHQASTVLLQLDRSCPTPRQMNWCQLLCSPSPRNFGSSPLTFGMKGLNLQAPLWFWLPSIITCISPIIDQSPCKFPVLVSVVRTDQGGDYKPTLCSPARAPICQLVQGSCQAFTAIVMAMRCRSHCTSPWQAVPYSAVTHLSWTRTLGDGRHI